jgi:hypothetical protein
MATTSASIHPATGMTDAEAWAFVRRHGEEFINRQDLSAADRIFAPDFRDHGTDVPPGLPPGPAGARAYVGAALARFLDLTVEILDPIADGDRIVVHNRWTGTAADSGIRHAFSGIVIRRLARRRLAERWAHIGAPRPVAPPPAGA